MASLRKKHSKNLRRFQSHLDANLQWQPVDTSGENLGKFDDAMFFGLEEVDGNAYINKKQSFLKQEPMNVVVTEDEQGRKGEGVDEEEGMMQLQEEEPDKEEKIPEALSKKKKAKKEKDKARREKAKKDKDKARAARARDQAAACKEEEEAVQDEDAPWGSSSPSSSSLQLHSLLVASLTGLNFSTPTPIQSSAIPKVLGADFSSTAKSSGAKGVPKGGIKGDRGPVMVDVVGSAETGSGKTLAFGLPVLHSLLHCWGTRGDSHQPFALILAPTRELAMQITSVLTDVCKSFRALRRVEVVNVIGGLSEHKQRRQLSGAGKPCHVLVATPGRLCDLLDDESAGALQDMSALRYLVVDEADRMMEDGHFPELHKIFGRITDHEALAAKGLCPVAEAKKNREGMDFSEDREETSGSGKKEAGNKQGKAEGMEEEEEGEMVGEDDDDSAEEFDLDAEPFQFEAFPSEQQLQQARASPHHAVPLHLREEDEDEDEDEHTVLEAPVEEEKRAAGHKGYVHKQRQTLLFSATAINVYNSGQQSKRRKGGGSKGGKDAKKKHIRLVELGLPDHLCQLLETVGLQDQTRVAHVLLVDKDGEEEGGDKKRKQPDGGQSAASATGSQQQQQGGEGATPALPRGLQQQEVRVATEDKDVLAYFFLLKHPGRTLLFVNSIKTARRVDGLLRALGLNCRCIHAQLQQKQRIKALESFVSSPVGILVATDVAARGLDLPKIQFVLHYDVARSPQVYVHRSGRTARAGQSGLALSIVAPEDTDHHKDVCGMLQVRALPLLRGMDLGTVPVVRERVKLAKKIFLQSFLSSQNTKQQSWLENTAKDAGLAIDDALQREMSHELDSATGARQRRDEAKAKKTLEGDRAQLRALLHEPYQEHLRINPRQKRAFIVVAK